MSAGQDFTNPAQSRDAEAAILRKVGRRLLPFLFLLYVVAYIDRVNVGFAALQMKSDLRFSDSVYGFGAGIFFVGYLLFQLPSNLVLVRIGARRWLSSIMILWGVISSCTMFVHSPASFYTFRFLLGAAEAGFFPGVIFYLTYWFPATARARSVSRFLLAMPISGIVGGPLAGLLLSLHGFHGLGGWQWLFLLEGIPAIVFGAVARFALTEGPENASWLDANERACLLAALAREGKPDEARRGSFFTSIVFRPEVWLLCVIYFTLTWSTYGIGLWLPTVVKNFSGFTDRMVGVLSAVPYLVSMAAISFVAIRSDKTRKPHLHFAGAVLAGAAAFFLSVWGHHLILSTALLSAAVAGIYSAYAPFWAMADESLLGPLAAAGIAFVNSLGNLGGLFGPYVTGIVKQRTGSFGAGSIVLGASLCVSAGLALGLKRIADNRGRM